jgi:hypothetical protein
MKKATHTPGPWKHYGGAVWSEHKSVSGKETRGTRTNHVCAVSPRLKMPDAEREANARLIAAAPDLIRLLSAMLNRYAVHTNGREEWQEAWALVDSIQVQTPTAT